MNRDYVQRLTSIITKTKFLQSIDFDQNVEFSKIYIFLIWKLCNMFVDFEIDL